MWTIITNFSGSTPVRRSLCSKLLRTFVQTSCSENTVHWPHFCRWQLRPMFIQSRMISSENHSILTSSVPSEKRTFSWSGHSRSFSVILIGVSRNPERGIFVRYSNVDLISEMYEDIATEKLQIRRFQRPHSSLTTVLREKPSNIYKQFILPETRSKDLNFCPDSVVAISVTRLSLKVKPSESETAGTKTEFDMK